MKSFDVDVLTLPALSAQHKTALRKGKITTAADLLLANPTHAAKRCRLSPIEFKQIIDIVCANFPLSLYPLQDITYEGDELFTTGDTDIDNALGGGIRTGMIWEIVGESSAGKTQLALQLSLLVQTNPSVGGLAGSCCYLTTSAKLPTRRQLQILKSHQLLSSVNGDCTLDNVHTLSIPSIDALLHVLLDTLPNFIDQTIKKAGAKPVKLVVIDALAELFHDTNKTTSTTLAERAQKIGDISSRLHNLAAELRLAIVVLNEVVDAFDTTVDDVGDGMSLFYSLQSRWFSRGDSVPGEDRKEASLGLVWANQVNVRILLSRTGRRRYLNASETKKVKYQRTDSPGTGPSKSSPAHNTFVQDDDQPTLIRRLNVLFSSVAAPVSLDYIVTDMGIVALPDTVIYTSSTVKPILDAPAQQEALSLPEFSIQDVIAPLDIGTMQDTEKDITNQDGELLQEGALLEEDEWDQFWEHDEIPPEVYLSVPENFGSS